MFFSFFPKAFFKPRIQILYRPNFLFFFFVVFIFRLVQNECLYLYESSAERVMIKESKGIGNDGYIFCSLSLSLCFARAEITVKLTFRIETYPIYTCTSHNGDAMDILRTTDSSLNFIVERLSHVYKKISSILFINPLKNKFKINKKIAGN